jgi:hypothetical protein
MAIDTQLAHNAVVLSSAREDGVGTPNCLYSAAQSPDGTYRSGRFADADA